MILLVAPLSNLAKARSYTRTSDAEPIAVECLAGVLADSGFVTKTLTGNITGHQFSQEVKKLKPRYIGFSVYTYTYENCLELAKKAKQIGSQLRFEPIIIFGGPHPSALPYEVIKETSVDYVVVGEGEIKLRELINAIEKGDLSPQIPGVITKNTVHTSAIEDARIADLDSLPLPLRVREKIVKSKTHQIMYPPHSLQKSMAPIYYSRGCPNNCSFCNSRNMYGSQVFWKSPKRVVQEFEQLQREFGSNLFFFTDLNLNIDRSKLLDLCLALEPLKTHWWGLFNPVQLDAELLNILKSSGCVKLSIGIETFRPQGISENSQKKFMLGKLQENLAEANQLGLIIKAYVIIALPDDSSSAIDVVNRELQAILDLPIDEVRVSVATPFPGTRFYESCLKDNLLMQDLHWDKFTTEELVYKHTTLKPSEVKKIRDDIVCNYYNSDHYINHALQKISTHKELQQSFLEYFAFLSRTSSSALKIISASVYAKLNNRSMRDDES